MLRCVRQSDLGDESSRSSASTELLDSGGDNAELYTSIFGQPPTSLSESEDHYRISMSTSLAAGPAPAPAATDTRASEIAGVSAVGIAGADTA